MEIQNYFINLEKVIFVKKDIKNLKIEICMINMHFITIDYTCLKDLNNDYYDLILLVP